MTNGQSNDDNQSALDDLCEDVLNHHDLDPQLEDVVRSLKRGVEDGDIDRY